MIWDFVQIFASVWLVYSFGKWRGRRGSVAATRRAYIAGVQDGLLWQEPSAPDVPPSPEVQAEDRRRS